MATDPSKSTSDSSSLCWCNYMRKFPCESGVKTTPQIDLALIQGQLSFRVASVRKQ